MAMFLGLFDILAVFSEDFKAKTMQVAIGRGVSRTQVVLTKLLDVAMVLLTDLVLFFVLTVGLSWGLGAPLTGSRLTQHVIDFLVQWLDGIGYTEYLSRPGMILCEWPERAEDALPADCVRVYLSRTENDGERTIEILMPGEAGEGEKKC